MKADFQFPQNVTVEVAGPLDVTKIAADAVARILADPAFAAQIARQLRVE